MPKVNEHAGHRQRMRERIARGGLDTLADHEVLEVLLYSAVPRSDTNALAHQLLKRFGSLAAVLDAEPEELAKQPGIGPAAAFNLHFAALVAARYFQNKTRRRPVYGSTHAFVAYAQALFIAEVREVAYMLCLDGNLRLINYFSLAHGSVNSVSVPVSEVIRKAVACNAQNVVLAHNHPSGRLKPSEEDLWLTRDCMQGLYYVNINLLDHLIICGGDYFSFAEHGYLTALYREPDEQSESGEAGEAEEAEATERKSERKPRQKAADAVILANKME